MIIAYIQNSYGYIILLGFIKFNYSWLLKIMFSINKFNKTTIYYFFFFWLLNLKKNLLVHSHLCYLYRNQKWTYLE